MAEMKSRSQFDETPQAYNPGSYVGLSEGIKVWGQGDGIETLFKGLANVIKQGSEAYEESEKNAIQNEVLDQVEGIQNEFMAPYQEGLDLLKNGLPGNQPEGTDPDVTGSTSRTAAPVVVKRGLDRVEKLVEAHASGNMSDSHYWARLNQMTKSLRSKYPGYRTLIDTVVSSATGDKPANALRRALMNEFSDAMKGTEQKKTKREALEERAAFQGMLPPDYYNDPAKYSDDALLQYFNNRQLATQQAAAQKASLEENLKLKGEQDKQFKEQARGSMQSEMASYVHKTLVDTQGAMGALGGNLNSIISRANEAAASGKPMSEQEIAQLVPQLNQLETTIRQNLNAMVWAPWGDDPKNTYGRHMSKTDIDNAVALAMEPINLLRQSVMGGESTAIMKYMATHNKAVESDATGQLQTKYPKLQMAKRVQDAFGPQIANRWLDTETVSSDIDQQILDFSIAEAGIGSGSFDKFLQEGLENNIKPETIKAYTDKWKKSIDQFTKGELPDDLIVNQSEAMFGRGANAILGKFNPQDKVRVLSSVASPDISKKMLKIRDIDPNTYLKYERFVVQGFQDTYKGGVERLDSYAQDPNFDIQFDPQSMQFKGAYTPQEGAEFFWQGGRQGEVSQVVNDINQALAILSPIMKERKGDTAQEMLFILDDMGYVPGAKTRSAAQFVGDAIIAAVSYGKAQAQKQREVEQSFMRN